MKPTIISLFLLLLVSGATTSCDKDEPDGKSIFVDPAEEKTEFDFWLDRHYTEPYNIRFEYRMPDRETHFNYWVSPPPVDKSIEVAKLIKYSTLDAMAELIEANQLNYPDRLVVGQALVIPGSSADTHTVLRGETLFLIAEK